MSSRRTSYLILTETPKRRGRKRFHDQYDWEHKSSKMDHETHHNWARNWFIGLVIGLVIVLGVAIGAYFFPLPDFNNAWIGWLRSDNITNKGTITTDTMNATNVMVGGCLDAEKCNCPEIVDLDERVTILNTNGVGGPCIIEVGDLNTQVCVNQDNTVTFELDGSEFLGTMRSDGSFEFGTLSTSASASGAVAFGSSTMASGPNSYSRGEYNNASGRSSSSVGRNTTANGDYSFSGGKGTVSEGEGSFAFGYVDDSPGSKIETTSTSLGGTTMGSANNGGQIISGADGSVSGGWARTEISRITTTPDAGGGMAFGYAEDTNITSDAYGAFARGYGIDYATIIAEGFGCSAQGSAGADGATLRCSGRGSMVHGDAQGGALLEATNSGAMAIGSSRADSVMSASGPGSFVGGESFVEGMMFAEDIGSRISGFALRGGAFRIWDDGVGSQATGRVGGPDATIEARFFGGLASGLVECYDCPGCSNWAYFGCADNAGRVLEGAYPSGGSIVAYGPGALSRGWAYDDGRIGAYYWGADSGGQAWLGLIIACEDGDNAKGTVYGRHAIICADNGGSMAIGWVESFPRNPFNVSIPNPNWGILEAGGSSIAFGNVRSIVDDSRNTFIVSSNSGMAGGTAQSGGQITAWRGIAHGWATLSSTIETKSFGAFVHGHANDNSLIEAAGAGSLARGSVDDGSTISTFAYGGDSSGRAIAGGAIRSGTSIFENESAGGCRANGYANGGSITCTGQGSVAEGVGLSGYDILASAPGSHAEGLGTRATASYSRAGGILAETHIMAMWAQGSEVLTADEPPAKKDDKNQHVTKEGGMATGEMAQWVHLIQSLKFMNPPSSYNQTIPGAPPQGYQPMWAGRLTVTGRDAIGFGYYLEHFDVVLAFNPGWQVVDFNSVSSRSGGTLNAGTTITAIGTNIQITASGAAGAQTWTLAWHVVQS